MQKQKSIESFSMTFHLGRKFTFPIPNLGGKGGRFSGDKRKVRFGLVKHENAPFSAKKNVFGGRTYSSWNAFCCSFKVFLQI